MFSEEYAQVLRSLMTADPQLPRPNPSTAFWQEPPHPTVANAQSSVLPETTDFVVIGSGITGCSVTKALLETPSLSGNRVTVLEARTICSSATGRNGGHLVSDAPDNFGHLAATFGMEPAKQIARFSFASIDRVKEVIAGLSNELREKTQLKEVTSVTGLGDFETLEMHKESLKMFDEALPEFIGRNELLNEKDAKNKFKFRDAVGAVMQHEAGALWPYRLITGIFEQLLQEHTERFSIETSTPVTSISYSSDPSHAKYPYTITTPRGSIYAAQVLHCTNAHASHLLPTLSGKVFPFRGTMSTQSRGTFPNLGSENSFSYMAKGAFEPSTKVWSWTLYYITQDPHTGDMYVGGETQKLDEILVSDDTVVGKTSSDTLSNMLPKIFSEGWEEETVVKSIWSGIIALTADGLPLVGRLTEGMTGRSGSGEWMAGGYNGHGMDKAWLTGEALVGMVLGREFPGFPRAYMLSEERLKRMDLEDVVQFLGSAGA